MKEEGFRPWGDGASPAPSNNTLWTLPPGGGKQDTRLNEKTTAEENKTLPKLESVLTELIALLEKL